MAQAGEAGDKEAVEKHILKRRESNRRLNIGYRRRHKTEKHVVASFNKLKPRYKLAFLRTLASQFPPFEGYNDEAAELIGVIEEGFEIE